MLQETDQSKKLANAVDRHHLAQYLPQDSAIELARRWNKFRDGYCSHRPFYALIYVAGGMSKAPTRRLADLIELPANGDQNLARKILLVTTALKPVASGLAHFHKIWPALSQRELFVLARDQTEEYLAELYGAHHEAVTKGRFDRNQSLFEAAYLMNRRYYKNAQKLLVKSIAQKEGFDFPRLPTAAAMRAANRHRHAYIQRLGYSPSGCDMTRHIRQTFSW